MHWEDEVARMVEIWLGTREVLTDVDLIDFAAFYELHRDQLPDPRNPTIVTVQVRFLI